MSLARALVVDPDLLLMDEPFSALDELTAARLREELVSLWARKECTVLFATHNIQEACYLADRVIVLSAHPGTVVGDINVDVPRPRCIDDPRLVKIAAHVRSLIDRSAPGSVFEEVA